MLFQTALFILFAGWLVTQFMYIGLMTPMNVLLAIILFGVIMKNRR